ncbi:hypothetical protein Tco_0233107 [Tanacetum coccineum]
MKSLDLLKNSRRHLERHGNDLRKCLEHVPTMDLQRKVSSNMDDRIDKLGGPNFESVKETNHYSSGVAYEGPLIPTNPSPKKVVEQETEETTDTKQTNFQGSTAHIQPPVIPIPILEPDVPKTLPKPNIPYPSRLNDQKLREKATNQMEKFFQIFQDLHFDISFADLLLVIAKNCL